MSDTPAEKTYKVVCISLYHNDIDELERKVVRLKKLGWTAANRSHLIRLALASLTDADLEKIAARASSTLVVERVKEAEVTNAAP